MNITNASKAPELERKIRRDFVQRYRISLLPLDNTESHKPHTELLYFFTLEMLVLIGEKISCFDTADVRMF